MEQILFERPREKLQAKGAAYLSTTELLQVIIGSGNAHVSGARLAKRVASLVDKQLITLESLLSIQGIGFAKACQIAAAIELGSRMNAIKHSQHKVGDLITQAVIKVMGKIRQKTILAYMYDGAGKEVHQVNYLLSNSTVVGRKVCADALFSNARKVSVAIGSKTGSLDLVSADLAFIKQLKDSLKILEIELTDVYVANEARVEKWKI